ncbi:MAG TPA: hypothetical protein VH208_06610, partial [Myxococcaceae bacterium]|nr:hypothetical protein [Myxococcaceae bacterium]
VYRDVMLGKDKLGPGGASIGAWLQNLPVGAKVGDFFFCHAGSTSHKTVQEIDDAVKTGVEADGWGTKFLSNDDSLVEARKEFWGKAGHDEIKEDAAKLGVDYIFYGHDPSKLEFPNGDKRQACTLFSHFSSDVKNGLLSDMLVGMDTCNSAAVQKDEGVKGTGRMLRITLKDGAGDKRGQIDAFDEKGRDKKYDRMLGTGN